MKDRGAQDHSNSTAARQSRIGAYGMIAIGLIVALAVINCGEVATLSVRDGTGTAPNLPAPARTIIPTVNIAPAIGWPAGTKPIPAAGTKVIAFAHSLDHPRWLYVLPNGDVLVAETNAPPKPNDANGIRGWFMKRAMKKAGAGTPSANRITLLRDIDRDGVADLRSVFLAGLNSPFGMALVDGNLYIANTDAVLRFPYVAGQTQISAPGRELLKLPAGEINHHWTKNLVASPDGAALYVSVGSNSNVGERGMEVEAGRAAIWQIDRISGEPRVFASGLRNPVGMAWVFSEVPSALPVLWTVVNERDELGSDLVPDYMTSVRDGGFYGWPYSYYGTHVDARVRPQRPDLVAKALVPDYALGPHTASLGLVNADGNALLASFKSGLFVGQHGSWNRKPHSGYKVIFIPFENAKPLGDTVDVLSGFLSEEGEAYGRPVGVALDSEGALLVADDVGNVIWRVSAADGSAPKS